MTDKFQTFDGFPTNPVKIGDEVPTNVKIAEKRTVKSPMRVKVSRLNSPSANLVVLIELLDL